jgi:hypothetical protein
MLSLALNSPPTTISIDHLFFRLLLLAIDASIGICSFLFAAAVV